MATRSGSSSKSKSTSKKRTSARTASSSKKKSAKKAAGSKKTTTKKKASAAKSAGKARAKQSAGSSKTKAAAKKAPKKKTKGAAAAPETAQQPADAATFMGLVPTDDADLPPVKINKRDMAYITKALQMLRARLSTDLEALSANNLTHSGRDLAGDLSGYGFHMADVATDNFAREMELNIATGETDRLRLVEEALDRVADGTYGRCQRCPEPIAVDRLKVIPYATLCIRCAEEVERE